MALLGSIYNTGLLAEKGIALVVNILDNLRPGAPIFYPKRVVFLLLLVVTIEIGHIV